MGEIFTVQDLPRYNGWREALEERQNYERERRERELTVERERQEREARKAEEKQQRAVANNSDAWYAAVDQRVVQLLEQHFFSGNLGVGGAVKGGIFDATIKLLTQLREEFKRDLEEQQRAFEAKLVEQREHFSQAAWVGWVDERIKATFALGREVLLAEVKSVIEEAQRAFETKLSTLEERVKAGLPSKLPLAKAYQSDSVHYRGDLITHAGATYQAACDTCREPPHDDWVCIARAGVDGHTPNFRGVFNANKIYARFDAAEFDGTSYIATCDNPGIPGFDAGWRVLARRGGKGPVGEAGRQGQRGARGARGEDAPTIVAWTLDCKNFRAIPTMSDGKAGAPLELRGLFEQFVLETS